MSAVCPDCHGHYESLLHAVCEARRKLQEREQWRINQVRIPPHARALMKLRRSATGSGRRLEEE